MNIRRFLMMLTLSVLVSCSKDPAGDDDILPIIQLDSPLDNAVFNGGDTVPINGDLSDNNRLSELHVHISNNATAELLIDIHRYPNAATYRLNESFQAQSGIDYKIQVIVKDNAANESRATVNISSN